MDDGYLEYKHNFASARLRFETGMREVEADSHPHSLSHTTCSPHLSHVLQRETDSAKVINNNSLTTTPTSTDHLTTRSNADPSMLLTPQPGTGSLTPQQNLELPLEVGVAWEAETQTEPYTEETVLSKTVLVNTGCQTDEDTKKGHQSSLKEQFYPKVAQTVSPVRDQEIQVIQEDLVNPLKRIISQRTRKYDLLEMPHLKRRVYQRRSGLTHQRRRTLSASDMPWQQHCDAVGVTEAWSGVEMATVSGNPETMVPWCTPDWAAAWSAPEVTWGKQGGTVAWNTPEMAMTSGKPKIMSDWWRPEGAAVCSGPEAAFNRPEVVLSELPDASPPISGNFGLTDSSSLVASLASLTQDLPSAYPDALPHDDLADLNPDNFSLFPESEISRLALWHGPGSIVAALNSSPVRVCRNTG